MTDFILDPRLAGDSVFIYIAPGTSTTGAGTVFLTFLPD